jgi:hypothetical protein
MVLHYRATLRICGEQRRPARSEKHQVRQPAILAALHLRVTHAPAFQAPRTRHHRAHQTTRHLTYSAESSATSAKRALKRVLVREMGRKRGREDAGGRRRLPGLDQ